jgi:hypothetical protein
VVLPQTRRRHEGEVVAVAVEKHYKREGEGGTVEEVIGG